MRCCVFFCFFYIYFSSKKSQKIDRETMCVCVCTRVYACVRVRVLRPAHRCCSALPSSPGRTHTCPPCRRHSCCTAGDRPSGRTHFLSSPPRSDTHRCSRCRGCRSPPRTPLPERRHTHGHMHRCVLFSDAQVVDKTQNTHWISCWTIVAASSFSNS